MTFSINNVKFYIDTCAYKSGTSTAAPHVAGVAALTSSQFSNVTRDWIRLRLRCPSDLASSSIREKRQSAMVNARKPVSDVVPDHDLLIYRWQSLPFAELEANTAINVDVLSYGKSSESSISILLHVNGSVVDSASIDRARCEHVGQS